MLSGGSAVPRDQNFFRVLYTRLRPLLNEPEENFRPTARCLIGSPDDPVRG